MSDSYVFLARDGQGLEHRGVLGGDSRMAVARALRSKGWVPVDILPNSAPRKTAPPAESKANAPASEETAKPLRGPGSARSQAAWTMSMRELAALLRAGIPLMRSLQLVADATAEPRVRGALQRIARDLDHGLNLAAAAEHERLTSGLLNGYDIAMLQVGEQTGRLPEAFADLHRQREFVRATAEQVSGALRYPSFVLLTCLAAIVVVNIFVLPAFAKVFAQAHATLPTLTLLLMSMSRLMLAWWPAGLVIVASGGFAWHRWVSGVRGRLWWDRNKLKLPVVGEILQGIVLARLARALSSSISAGLTITDSIQVSGRTLDNQWFETNLAQMVADLARGASIGAAARRMNVLPPTMLQLFVIGEEAGSLEELMREISIHYQDEVDISVRRLSATLEPILIWFLGLGVLILALGVFMPMWDLGRASLH